MLATIYHHKKLDIKLKLQILLHIKIVGRIKLIQRYGISIIRTNRLGFYALHATSLCKIGRPCVLLTKETNEHDIVHVLIHEELHHVMHTISEKDRIDAWIPTIEETIMELEL